MRNKFGSKSGSRIHKAVVEAMERRMLLSSSITLDPTFGSGGIVTQQINAPGAPLYSSSGALAELPNGQTLIAGYVTFAEATGIVIERFNVNGSLDTTFAPGLGYEGQNGYVFVATTAGPPPARPVDLSVGSAGDIYLGGPGIGILRFSPNGVPDRSFGDDGVAPVASMGGFYLEPNGQILVASGTSTLALLNANGKADKSFGSSGSVTLPAGFDQADGVLALQTNGKILIGGTVSDAFGNSYISVLRLNSDGTVDTSFGTSGVATANQLPEEQQGDDSQARYSATASGLAVLADGTIVVAGTSGISALAARDVGFTVAEFLSDGELSPTFGNAGQTSAYSPDFDSGSQASSLLVETDGSLIIAGTEYFTPLPPPYSSNFLLVRYSADGSVADHVDTVAYSQNAYNNLDQAAAGPDGTIVALSIFGPAAGPYANLTVNGPLLARYLTAPSGSVSGTVYSDYAGNPANFKTPVAGQIIYADLNNNGRLDPGEPSTVTNSAGQYTLTGLPAGNVIIRDSLPGNERQSYPGGGSGEHVTIGPTPIAGVNFSVTTDIYVSGAVTKPAGAGAVQVYADLNDNGKLDAGEPVVTAASNGSFDFEALSPGSYTFRIIAPAGYAQASPANDAGITVTLGSGGVDTHLAFIVSLPVKKLTGTVIGTTGSYEDQGNTIAKAFDGNLSTFFDAPQASGAWAGLDLGTAQVVTQVQYAPRSEFDSRMVGGEIQASNSANFSSGVVTLFTITSAPQADMLTTQLLSNRTAYRYYRYIGPTDGYCNIAELEFFG